jgi:hypothetical protein
MQKKHSSSKTIFLPLEQMMREKLYSSLNEPFQKHLLASWEEFFQNRFDDLFPELEKKHINISFVAINTLS